MNTSSKYTLIVIAANLFCGFILLVIIFKSLATALNFVGNLLPEITIAIITMLIAGYFMGNKIKNAIVLEQRNPVLTGEFALIVILALGIIAGGSSAILMDSITSQSPEGVYRKYYVAPALLIVPVAIVPIIVSGGILGLSIYNLYGPKSNTK